MLELQNITFGFGNGKTLLNNLSLSLEQGKVYALMGANGSGKTTLFNIITGFHKPSKGKTYFKGINLTKLPPYKINRSGIGRTFQDLRLITKLTVKENVLLAMKGNPTDIWYRSILPQSFYKKEIEALELKADAILEEYFLADVKYSLAGEISYGQQKLLTLACCVANNAELLLLDEPLSGVNEEYVTILKDKIHNIVSGRKTVLLIDHHTEFISEVSEKIFFLNKGQINSFNSIEEFKNDPEVVEIYIS